MMRVVAGLALSPGTGFGVEALMGLRRDNVKRPSMWEFPGGKVEPGEDDHPALAREWREELGIRICPVGAPIVEISFDLEVPFTVVLYQVMIHLGETIKKLDHVDLDWIVPAYAIEWLPCAPAQYLFYPMVRDLIAKGYRP